MKILMLAPQPCFEPRGTPLSVLERLKVLSARGHEVDLVTYHVGRDVAIPNVVIHRTLNISPIKYIRIGPSPAKLLLDIFLLIKALRLLQKGHYDLLYSHEEASYFAMYLAKLFNVRHLYDMHSSLPEQMRHSPYACYRYFYPLFKWFERKVINSSDSVITICPALDEYIKKINPNVPSHIIENVATLGDPQTLSKKTLQEFKDTHFLNGSKIILYTGNFERHQGLDLLIDSAERVIKLRKDVMFLLIGGYPSQISRYQNQVKKLGLSAHFRFIGTLQPEEIQQAIQISHILVSPRTEGINTPSKIYPYLRFGKPIVATNLHTHTQVLKPSVAALVEPSPDALGHGILTLLQNPPFANRLGVRAKQHFKKHYKLGTFIQRTEQALQMAMR